MEIRRSPEIEAVTTRWLDAQVTRRGATLENLLSASEHARYIGSDDGEFWEGPLLRQGFAAHAAEIPDFTLECQRLEGFECGPLGWANWLGSVTFAHLEGSRPVRYSWVLVLEDGIWKILQSHVSLPTPNVEVFGREHFAFAELIEKARRAPDLLASEGAATILFTDIANSSRIAATLGDRAWAATVGRRIGRQAEVIERHGGALVKTLGDGMMARFAAGGEAARAAIQIQRRNRADAAEPAVEIRIGIHSGSVVATGGDFFGAVVNKAARIASIANPGEILLSETTADEIGRLDGFTLGAPVEVALRGVAGRHHVLALDWQVG